MNTNLSPEYILMLLSGVIAPLVTYFGLLRLMQKTSLYKYFVPLAVLSTVTLVFWSNISEYLLRFSHQAWIPERLQAPIYLLVMTELVAICMGLTFGGFSAWASHKTSKAQERHNNAKRSK